VETAGKGGRPGDAKDALSRSTVGTDGQPAVGKNALGERLEVGKCTAGKVSLADNGKGAVGEKRHVDQDAGGMDLQAGHGEVAVGENRQVCQDTVWKDSQTHLSPTAAGKNRQVQQAAAGNDGLAWDAKGSVGETHPVWQDAAAAESLAGGSKDVVRKDGQAQSSKDTAGEKHHACPDAIGKNGQGEDGQEDAVGKDGQTTDDKNAVDEKLPVGQGAAKQDERPKDRKNASGTGHLVIQDAEEKGDLADNGKSVLDDTLRAGQAAVAKGGQDVGGQEAAVGKDDRTRHDKDAVDEKRPMVQDAIVKAGRAEDGKYAYVVGEGRSVGQDAVGKDGLSDNGTDAGDDKFPVFWDAVEDGRAEGSKDVEGGKCAVDNAVGKDAQAQGGGRDTVDEKHPVGQDTILKAGQAADGKYVVGEGCTVGHDAVAKDGEAEDDSDAVREGCQIGQNTVEKDGQANNSGDAVSVKRQGGQDAILKDGRGEDNKDSAGGKVPPFSSMDKELNSRSLKFGTEIYTADNVAMCAKAVAEASTDTANDGNAHANLLTFRESSGGETGATRIAAAVGRNGNRAVLGAILNTDSETASSDVDKQCAPGIDSEAVLGSAPNTCEVARVDDLVDVHATPKRKDGMSHQRER
jgi:hypothetical protein